MQLKILVPFQVFLERDSVIRIIAETQQGCYGILPHRLDCAAALVPGILTYETEAEGETYIAVDEGVLVKTGREVLVSVRNAVTGEGLGKLREKVDQDFVNIGEREKNARSVLTKLETRLIRQLLKFQHE